MTDTKTIRWEAVLDDRVSCGCENSDVLIPELGPLPEARPYCFPCVVTPWDDEDES